MKKLNYGLLSFFCICLFSSCATIVSKSNWPLTVNTTPSGAKIEITNKKGATIYNGITPSTVSLASGDGFFAKQSYQIKLTLDGYNEKIIPVECKLNGWYFGNIIFGGLIGLLIVDPATGAMYKLETKYINEGLEKKGSSDTASLNILDINDIPAPMRNHLVAINH
ncbi:MAG: hypothetical protein H6Q14_1604 [Bacteroidetes bacterium]|jgi:hypothetical protein|nr:hypothetical protein [Bacteroidota bacterium]